MFILFSSAFFGPMNSMASPIFEYKASTSTEQNISILFDIAGSICGPNCQGSNVDFVVDDNNIYLVYYSSVLSGVFFSSSTVTPPSFSDPIVNPDALCIPGFIGAIPGGPDTSCSNPKIVLVGPSSVIYAWQEDDSSGNRIGVSFGDGINPPASYPVSAFDGAQSISQLKLVTANGNAHLVWKEGSGSTAQIVYGFVSSVGSVTTTPISGVGDFDEPDIAASGSDVYVSWTDTAADEIHLSRSTDNFVTIPSDEIVADTGVPSNSKITANGSTVLISWLENTSFSQQTIQYYASSSEILAPVAGTPLSQSSLFAKNIQLASSGTNAYLVWQNGTSDISIDNDIVFGKISTFTTIPSSGSLINLSQGLTPSTNSLEPRISASGDDVHVVWQDSIVNSLSDNELLLRSSTDTGDSFGGLQIITENPDPPVYADPIPVISSSDSRVGVSWDGFTDIFFKHGDSSAIDVSFDQIEYSLAPNTATVTVVDTTTNTDVENKDTITIQIDNQGTGIDYNPLGDADVVLIETAISSGIFSGGIILSDFSAESGDVFRADYTTGLQKFSTFAKITGLPGIGVTFNPPDTPLDFGKIYGIKVLDNSKLGGSPLDTAVVTITSPTDLLGTTVTLTEDPGNSGIFTGTANLVFVDGNIEPTSTDSILISQANSPSPSGLIQTNSIFLSSTTTSPTTYPITLTETSETSNDYSGILNFCNTPGCSSSSSSNLEVAAGDFFTISNPPSGLIKTNGMIYPDNTSDSRAAIKVSCTISSNCGTVTLSYEGSSATKTVETDSFLPGGGGGGISRAGFVVNFIAGAGGGGSGGNRPPTFGTSSFAIIEGGQEGFGGILNDNDVNTLEQTKTFKVGQKAVLRFDFIEGGGIGNIEHIGLYTNVRDGQKRQDSDAYIYYD